MKKADVLKYFAAQPDDPATIRHKRSGPQLGAIRKTANALGISYHAVYLWGDDVPELMAYRLERMTGGKLKV